MSVPHNDLYISADSSSESESEEPDLDVKGFKPVDRERKKTIN